MKPFLWMLSALAIGLTACTPPATPAPVTLTAPVPTATSEPLDLAPPMEIGSRMTYVDGATLVAVPSGDFIMGHGTTDYPEHSVNLSAFWIYATEVTNRQYALCVQAGRCSPPDLTDNLDYSDFAAQNQPVVGVTYDQAESYCSYVNGTLPTEAQWEKAARGPKDSIYPWGEADPSCKLLNFNDCEHGATDVNQYEKGRSAYGAYDMAGNVYEWVADWYDALYYKTSPGVDPSGPQDGKARVIRSSSYRSNADQSLMYARSFTSPGDHRRDLGFRCVVTDPTYFAPSCSLASVAAGLDPASLSVDCPTISIDVQPKACRYGGGAIVTFNDDRANDPNASFGGIAGCKLISGTPGSYPLQFECKKSSIAVMSTNCTYSGVADTTCGPHYTLNTETGLCEWDGNRTSGLECASGSFYDPVHHCCVSATGASVPQVCPVGTILTEDRANHYVCLPGGSALNVPKETANVNPPVCPGCQLTAETCAARNLVFCSTTCSCLSVGIKCPTH